ncbi:MAG: hypothetical protein M3487_08915, partial [Actinomycetota bacterium]|nr:hypothetical protein [Actinomycetota bacterium]
MADATPTGGIELGRPGWRPRVGGFGRRWLPQLQFGADAASWCVALFAATFLRYDMRIGSVNEAGILVAALIAVAAQGTVGLALGLYRRRFHYGSFEEMRVVAAAMAIVSMVLFVAARTFGGTLIPRSVPFLAVFAALVLSSVVRYVARLLEERHLRPSELLAAPLVVLGAGQSGAQIVRTMLRTPESPYRPVALLDDDPRKARLRISGLSVHGTGDDAVATAQRYGASSVLVAIPSITGDRLQALATPLHDAGIEVLVLPPVAQLLGKIRPS